MSEEIIKNKFIGEYKGIDREATKRAELRWNSIAKPLHSLGRFEDMIIKIAGITGTENVNLDKKCVIVMCGDNGVVEEGVTQSDSEVTTIVANAMALGDGNINSLCNSFGADVITVDIGMKTAGSEEKIIDCCVARGTKNITKGKAMTTEECEKAIFHGMNLVKECKEKGYKIIATGEMGIGNTTTSSALAAIILNKEVEEVTGRGAGLSKEGIDRKIKAIKRAIEINNPPKIEEAEKNVDLGIELLSSLGGFDIAGLTGVFLGGAKYHVPIVIDGFISAIAAAMAKVIFKESVNYCIPSHISEEPAARAVINYLGVSPVLDAGMCLGEGTGAVMIFPLLDGVLNLYDSKHLFNNLEIEPYEELS